ncbi:MAG: putative pyruvate formate lyase activating enzyme [Archaeoglobi archaeon]|nr:putative pyruvate formate lyase activating enzyme [Archaeoglobi archaeon]
MEFEPSYLELMRSGELKERIRELYSILESCELCPRKCHVNRMKGEEGYCRSDATPMVSSYFPHFGEEDVLVGRNGSGTIFLGLRLPIVWNCSGYENVEIIRLLEGIVDIYMPDMKYSSEEPARKYSNAPDYFERCKEAVKEMHRQVGDLKVDERGIAYRGLIIRHLVLPNDLAGSEEILRFIAEEISRNTYVNIMAQYRPEGEAYRYEELNRRITREEFMRVIEIAKKLNLRLNLV